MSLGQIILLILSIALFFTIAININRTFMLKAQELYKQHTDSNALALGEYLLEQAWTKSFDEETIDETPDEIPSGFSSSYSLGSDNESYSDNPFYDDVDDYNGMNEKIEFAEVEYEVRGEVTYCDMNGNKTSQKTNHKLIIFEISNPAEDISVVVRHVYAYLPN